MNYRFLKPDNQRQVIVFTYENDDGEEQTHDLPATVEVCDRCGGRGVHDPDGFSAGFSADDFAQDPDFAEDYMRGTYDVRCTECHGRNVVLVVDRDRADKDVLATMDQWCDDEHAYRAEVAAERRMGC